MKAGGGIENRCLGFRWVAGIATGLTWILLLPFAIIHGFLGVFPLFLIALAVGKGLVASGYYWLGSGQPAQWPDWSAAPPLLGLSALHLLPSLIQLALSGCLASVLSGGHRHGRRAATVLVASLLVAWCVHLGYKDLRLSPVIIASLPYSLFGVLLCGSVAAPLAWSLERRFQKPSAPPEAQFPPPRTGTIAGNPLVMEKPPAITE